jgi:hypothetical protein
MNKYAVVTVALTILPGISVAQDVFASNSTSDPCQQARTAEATLHAANIKSLQEREVRIREEYSRGMNNCQAITCRDAVSEKESVQLREVHIARVDEDTRHNKELLRIDSSCTAATISKSNDPCQQARNAEKAMYDAHQLGFKLRDADIRNQYTRDFLRCQDLDCKNRVSETESMQLLQLEADARNEEVRHRKEMSRIEAQCKPAPVYTVETYPQSISIPLHRTSTRRSGALGRTDSDEIRELTCPYNETAIVGATIIIEDDKVNYLRVDCATVKVITLVNKKARQKILGWTTDTYPGDSTGTPGTSKNAIQVRIQCPEPYIVAGIYGGTDPSGDHVRDFTFDCALVRPNPIDGNFQITSIPELSMYGQGGMRRNAQTQGNAQLSTRTEANRDLTMTLGLSYRQSIRATGFNVSSLVVGVHTDWFGKETVRSIALRSAGEFRPR